MRQIMRSPWFAFGALALGFELPMLFAPAPLRLSGEPFVLAALWLAGERLRFGAALRAAAVAAFVVLFVHRVDRVAFLRLMGDQPLLYDQLFLVRHLIVLIGDLWSAESALMVLGGLLAFALTAYALRSALARLVLPEAQRQRAGLRLALAVLPPLALFSALPPGGAPLVRWQAADFAADVAHSVQIYAAVRGQLERSAYRAYDRIALTRKPDVYWFWVESYGRVIAERGALRAAWAAQMSGMHERLRARGWHAVSAYSQSPIMGGRSWLAEATAFTGTQVAYHAVFHHLIGVMDRLPHMVGFFDRQAYRTVLLAPADRVRPGVRNVNHYRFERVVRFDDLDYRGSKVGWGLVPDQYSLWHTHEHVLRALRPPRFFVFHMVSSHAPWKQIPALVPDWRTLNDGRGVSQRAVKRDEARYQLKRFLRGTRVFPRMGELTDELATRYRDAVLYDLALLDRYLSELSGDALAIVIGDHQPPFLAAHLRSFDTPIHVFARDPELLAEFREHGFRDGLLLGEREHAATTHAGLFSLLVRALVRCCGTGQLLPPYRGDGVAIFSGVL